MSFLDGLFNIGQSINQNLPQVNPPNRDVFGSMGLAPVTIGGQGFESDDDFMARRMRELYQPRYDMQRGFEELINNYPSREQYAPSGLRKVGAVLAGIGSRDPLGTSDRFLNFHRDRAIDDWTNQAKFSQSAADNERLYNINERQFADQIINRDIQNRRLAETNRSALEREQQARTREENRVSQFERTMNLKEWMSKNQVQSSQVLGNGNVGVLTKDGRLVDTGVESGKLTDLQKLEIGLENTMEAISAREDSSRRLIGDREDSEGRLIEKRDDIRDENAIMDEALRRTRPPTQRGSGSPALEETRNITLRVRRAKTHPELGKWVQEGTAGKFDVTPTRYVFGQHISGPTNEERAAILDYINGKTTEIVVPKKDNSPRIKSEGVSVKPPQSVDPNLAGTYSRDEAIKILRDNGKPQTPANIEYIMKQRRR